MALVSVILMNLLFLGFMVVNSGSFHGTTDLLMAALWLLYEDQQEQQKQTEKTTEIWRLT